MLQNFKDEHNQPVSFLQRLRKILDLSGSSALGVAMLTRGLAWPLGVNGTQFYMDFKDFIAQLHVEFWRGTYRHDDDDRKTPPESVHIELPPPAGWKNLITIMRQLGKKASAVLQQVQTTLHDTLDSLQESLSILERAADQTAEYIANVVRRVQENLTEFLQRVVVWGKETFWEPLNSTLSALKRFVFGGSSHQVPYEIIESMESLKSKIRLKISEVKTEIDWMNDEMPNDSN